MHKTEIKSLFLDTRWLNDADVRSGRQDLFSVGKRKIDKKDFSIKQIKIKAVFFPRYLSTEMLAHSSKIFFINVLCF